MTRNKKMKEQTEDMKEEIDPFYGQPIGSRRLEIEKLRSKLQEKKHAMNERVYNKYRPSFEVINVDRELNLPDYIRKLNKQGYFDLLSLSQGEYNQIDESPLARILNNDFSELCDRSNHENMLDATGAGFRDNDPDPVLSTVLDDRVYALNVPGNTKKERKKARHRSDIFRRRLQKHVYERYLSEAVGRPITIEEYEREFGFLSDKSTDEI